MNERQHAGADAQPPTASELESESEKVHELPDLRAGIHLLARLARFAERTCLESGISLPQYRLLVSASGEPQRASELAEAVGVSRPTLTSLVDKMEKAGLVRRVPEPTDGRGIRLELTEAGREARRRAEHALTSRLLALLDGDLPDLLEVSSRLIERLSRGLDRELGTE